MEEGGDDQWTEGMKKRQEETVSNMAETPCEYRTRKREHTRGGWGVGVNTTRRRGHTGGGWGVGVDAAQGREDTPAKGGDRGDCPGGRGALKPASCGQHGFCCGSSASSGRPRRAPPMPWQVGHLYQASHEKDKVRDTFC